jgi:hypothetical protein
MLMFSMLGVCELRVSAVSVVVGVAVWEGRMWRLVWRLVGFQPCSFGGRELGMAGTSALASRHIFDFVHSIRRNYNYLFVPCYALGLFVGI